LCRQKELLHSGLHIHLQDQYSIPFSFLRCDKRMAGIPLRVDSNKRLINLLYSLSELSIKFILT
jgi:hypothetical protein